MQRSKATLAIALILAVGALNAQTTWKSGGKPATRHRVEVESPINEAEAAMEKNDLAKAEKLLREVVENNPKDYRGWFDLGYVLNAQGKPDESIAAYRKSVAANGAVFESNLNLGLMLAKAGSPDAEKYLKAATQLKPATHPERGWTKAWLGLGDVLEKTNPKGAVEAFRAASTFSPKDPEPHMSAALILEQLKQFPAAEAEYKRVAELEPKSSEAVAGLVNVYMETGRMAEAETALRKYLQIDPNNATAHVQLGRVLSATGKKDDAAQEFQTVLKLSPGDTGVARELAAILIEQKKTAQAESILRSAIASSPNDAGLQQELGRALLKEGRSSEAQAALLRAVQLTPSPGELYGELALAANDNKDYVLTLQALDARTKAGLQETPGTYFLRATAYDHLRDKKQAAEYYHLFLDSANGKFPDQEWQARHRLVAIEPKK